MSSYTIRVLNKYEDPESYVLFADPPKLNSEGTSVFSNAYMTSDQVDTPNGEAEFGFTREFYGVCGTDKTGQLKPGQHIKTSDHTDIVTLGTSKQAGTTVVFSIPSAGGAQVKISKDPTTESIDDTLSAFVINTEQYEKPEDRLIFVGLGAMGDDGKTVRPIATWEARPSKTYIVEPKVVYYIGTGKRTLGTLATITEHDKDYARVEFTGGKHLAIVTHNSNGSWSCEYKKE